MIIYSEFRTNDPNDMWVEGTVDNADAESIKGILIATVYNKLFVQATDKGLKLIDFDLWYDKMQYVWRFNATLTK